MTIDQELENNKKEKGKIMLVDDEVSIRRVMERILCVGGYEVDTYDNGEQAIKAYDSSTELVLLDIMMPGINGIETYFELKEKNPDLKAAFISGYGGGIAREYKERGEVDKYNELLGLHFIGKPVSIQTLLAVAAEQIKPLNIPVAKEDVEIMKEILISERPYFGIDTDKNLYRLNTDKDTNYTLLKRDFKF